MTATSNFWPAFCLVKSSRPREAPFCWHNCSAATSVPVAAATNTNHEDDRNRWTFSTGSSGSRWRNRMLVICGVMAVGVAGSFSLRQLDIDAFPDTTPVQVQINTVAPALSPEEVERQITFPIEQAISGLPGLEQLRSISKFGLSQVVVLFEDGTDIYFARQLISERLATVEMSQSIGRPKMGPVATGLGEVFHYIVTGQGTDPTDLRTHPRLGHQASDANRARDGRNQ